MLLSHLVRARACAAARPISRNYRDRGYLLPARKCAGCNGCEIIPRFLAAFGSAFETSTTRLDCAFRVQPAANPRNYLPSPVHPSIRFSSRKLASAPARANDIFLRYVPASAQETNPQPKPDDETVSKKYLALRHNFYLAINCNWL